MNVTTDLFGHALSQFYFHNDTAKLYSQSNISDWDEYPLPYLFRTFEQMPKIERKALSLVNGKILDVGCGAGSHSLYLEETGFDITAIDASKDAVKVAKARGVTQVKYTPLLAFQNDGFDTILMLMNGTGIFETIDKMPQYLDKLKTLLTPTGCILIDSSDLRYMYDSEIHGSIWVPADRYYGALEYRLRFKNKLSEPFPWLFLDKNYFAVLAQANGWDFEVIFDGDHHDYLARLTPKGH